MKKSLLRVGTSGLLVLYALLFSLSAIHPVPPPECVGQLTAVLLPTDTNGDGTPDVGLATILATDLVVNPLPHPVEYSLRLNGQLPDIQRYGLVLDCSFTDLFDLQGTPVGFKVDVWENGAFVDSCATTVLLQDQAGICAQCNCGSTIEGSIKTITGAAMSYYEMSVSPYPEVNVNLQANGSYSFGNIPFGSDITIEPRCNTNYLDGVSTLDLVLIQRHILSVQKLDTPFKLIAADVNQSGNISLLDAILVRRLILHGLDEFPNGKSWRFIPVSYSFPVPINPWFESFPEVININDIQGFNINQNFTAIKLGDVNGSASGM